MSESFDDQTYGHEPYTVPESKKKINGWLIALIVVLVLIVLCFLCVCLAVAFFVPVSSSVWPTIVQTLEIPVP